MIFYKNGKWHLCNEKVRYIQRDEEIEQYVGAEGHDWWINFEHEHTEIIEFMPVKPTEKQLIRLEEINELSIPEGFGSMIENYVKDGQFPEEIIHPLKELQLQKQNEQLEIALLETTTFLANEQMKNMQNEQAILELTTLMAGGAE